MQRTHLNSLAKATAAALILLLAACGSVTPAPESASDPGYLLTVQVGPSDTAESIAQRYGVEPMVWQPEVGFAILKLSSAQAASLRSGRVSLQNTTLEANSTLNVPMAQAQSATAGGFSAWAGGFSAWAGGFSAWAGGWSAWAGGSTPPAPPAENNSVWAMMQLRQAHALAKNFGAGVKVAVIDTGLDTAHPMLSGRLAPAAEWRDFVDGDANPQEASGAAFGHGTGAAGLIVQVAPRVTILPIRVLGPDGSGSLANVVSGINHAINMGARVINLSLGAEQGTTALLNVLASAKQKGVYVVASAGNNGRNNGVTFPGGYAWWSEVHPFLISVGSFNRRSELSQFSAYGNNFVMGGVGEQVVSAYPGSRTAQYTGTSFAAPLVSGTLALAFGETGDASVRANLWQLATLSIFTNDIWSKTRAARSLTSDINIGYGIISAANLLRILPGFVEPSSSLTNLLPNGGFETTTGWGFDGASRVTSGQRSGTGALAVGAGGIWGSWIAVSPNTNYTLTGWFSFANPATDTVNLTLSESNPSQTYIGETSSLIYHNTVGHTSRSLTLTTGPNTAFLRVSIWRGGTMTGSVFVDDLRLVRNP